METMTAPAVAGETDAQPSEAPATACTVGREELEVALHNACLWASSDTARPILAAVLVERADGEDLRLVSTDTYMLGVDLLEVDGADCWPASVLLQRDGLLEVVKVCKAAKRDGVRVVRIEPGERAFTFTAGARSFAVPVVDGEFPNWQQLTAEHTGDRVHKVGLNTDRFAQLAKVRGVGSGREYVVVSLEWATESKPARFEVHGHGSRLWGLVMPIRL